VVWFGGVVDCGTDGKNQKLTAHDQG
jgi:hypothetical protein